MLRIWGRITSLNVRKVVLAAQALQLAFERIDAGRQFGVVDTPAYRALNPNGLVPVIEDQGFVLYESNAIVRYLCARYASAGTAGGTGGSAGPLVGTLYPEALPARFDAERWMDWQQTTLNPAGGPAFLQLVRAAPETRDHAAIARSVAATEPLWTMLDAHLARQPFLAGAQFTMADIPVACEAHRWFNLPRGADAPEAAVRWPHLWRWYDGIAARPAARGVLDQPLA